MAKKRVKRRKKDTMVPKLIILVALVLVVFEGRLIVTMINHRAVMTGRTVTEGAAAKESSGTLKNSSDDSSAKPADDTSAAQTTASSDSFPDTVLAGLPGLTGASAEETSIERLPTVSNPDSTAIVREADTPVDDSYFSDAVFIGDSRMEGFRNVSGITQGKFFTSVGMSLSGLISEPIIKDGDDKITVAAAVSGGIYNKIYLMLGTNDLGEYDLDGFHDRFTSATQRLLELQPNAVFYVCSIIYVEEDKVQTGEYVNNTNVDKLNAILLQICEEQGYHYLDLNEILSDGQGSLIQDASSDGVHIYEKYCKQMLDYLKSHYITVDSAEPEESTEAETDDGDSV